jgi:hypothetical protein
VRGSRGSRGSRGGCGSRCDGEWCACSSFVLSDLFFCEVGGRRVRGDVIDPFRKHKVQLEQVISYLHVCNEAQEEEKLKSAENFI